MKVVGLNGILQLSIIITTEDIKYIQKRSNPSPSLKSIHPYPFLPIPHPSPLSHPYVLTTTTTLPPLTPSTPLASLPLLQPPLDTNPLLMFLLDPQFLDLVAHILQFVFHEGFHCVQAEFIFAD